MNIGKLDRRIRLQSVNEHRDAYGASILTFGTWTSVFAQWKPIRASEQMQSGHVQGELVGVFRIRWIPAITEKWRIEYDGQLYEVIGIPKEAGRREALDLDVRLVR